MIPDQLKIQPGQEVLTPEQEAYAREFASKRYAAIFSTTSIDEQEAEKHQQAMYRAAGQEPPLTRRWFDSPLTFVKECMPYEEQFRVHLKAVRASWDKEKLHEQFDGHCPLDCQDVCSLHSWLDWDDSIHAPLPKWRHLEQEQVGIFHLTFQANVRPDSKGARLASRVQAIMHADLLRLMSAMVKTMVVDSMPNCPEGTVSCGSIFLDASVVAYGNACELVLYQFFHELFEENELIHLALLNEMVSGYHLDREKAWLVRKPTLLERDAQGRPPSASGPCIQYRDGWGVYAWHGVRVPEQVILAPERLTRQDFLNARHIEVRRVIQECMGSRFVSELGGVVIDRGPRGTLYEVRLPVDDPERVARYVQVQDASTPRPYFLRVPPTVKTAAEAVAWSFQVGVEDYHPTQET